MAHNFNTISHPNKTVFGTLIAGAFLTAVGVEKVATDSHRRRFNKKARVISHPREEGKAIYIMPGCRTDGEYIGEMLEPHLQHIGTTHHEAYADDDFDLEDLKQKELETRARDLGKAAIVYCSSMGGMKFTMSLADKNFRDKFGQIDTIILDSSPADMNDLDSGTRFAMFASRVLPPSWTVSQLYKSAMMRKTRRLHHHSPRVSDDQVRGHLRSSANTPLLAVREQANFIRQTHLTQIPDGELRDVANNIYFISSAHDRVVNTDAAYKEYNRIFGGKVIRLVDTARDPIGHADGPEHPELIISLMEGNPPLSDSLYVKENMDILNSMRHSSILTAA